MAFPVAREGAAKRVRLVACGERVFRDQLRKHAIKKIDVASTLACEPSILLELPRE